MAKKLNLAIILTATILLVGCGEKDAKYGGVSKSMLTQTCP